MHPDLSALRSPRAFFARSVQVTDNADPPTTMSGYAIVSIRIADVNEAPTISPQFLTVVENSASDTQCVPAVGGLGAPGMDVDAGDVIRSVCTWMLMAGWL